MAHGYAGKLLFVDLTAKTIMEEAPGEAFYRSIVGGTGLGARILYERMKPGPIRSVPTTCWASSPVRSPPQAFMAGAVHGHYQVTAHGRVADSNCGGTSGLS